MSLLLVAVWPLGMPLATLLLMIKIRHALIEKRATFLTRTLSFLHREYEPHVYW